MKIRFYAVGKLRESPELQIFNRYRLRLRDLGKSTNISSLEVYELDESKWVKNIKSKKIFLSNKNKSYKFLMDQNGVLLTSEDLADKVRNKREQGVEEIIFFIGGAEGFPDGFEKNFNEVISFGRMVWPHLLVRVMLMEQIYRAGTIISGLPYHKG